MFVPQVLIRFIIQFADFIQPDAEHILGSQCDQKILSKKESSGVVFSPNYPLPYQVKNRQNESNFCEPVLMLVSNVLRNLFI